MEPLPKVNFDVHAVQCVADVLPGSKPAYACVFRSGQALFIRIGGQLAHADSGRKVIHVGPVGLAAASFAQWLASEERIMSPERIAELDSTPPGEVCGQHKHDVVVPLDDVAAATIEPWSFFAGLGAYLAQFRLRLVSGKKLTFQITDAADLEVALKAIPGIFGDRVRVKVTWDNKQQKVVKV